MPINAGIGSHWGETSQGSVMTGSQWASVSARPFSYPKPHKNGAQHRSDLRRAVALNFPWPHRINEYNMNIYHLYVNKIYSYLDSDTWTFTLMVSVGFEISGSFSMFSLCILTCMPASPWIKQETHRPIDTHTNSLVSVWLEGQRTVSVPWPPTEMRLQRDQKTANKK